MTSIQRNTQIRGLLFGRHRDTESIHLSTLGFRVFRELVLSELTIDEMKARQNSTHLAVGFVRS